MIEKLISDLEGKVKEAKTLEDAKKAELLGLVGKLKTEVTELSRTHSEEATSVANFVQVSVSESLRERRNPGLLQIALDGTRISVEKFELSHPLLTRVVNSLCTQLSNVGI